MGQMASSTPGGMGEPLRPLRAIVRIFHEVSTGLSRHRSGGPARLSPVRQRGAPRTDDPGIRQAIVEPHARRQAMQRRLLTQIPGMTLAVMLTLLIGQGAVVGHADSKGVKADRIEGVWDEQVIITDCATGESTGREFPGTIMFLHGGQLIETPGTPLVAPMLPPPPIPARRGHVGLGSWHHLSGRHYTAAFRFFRFIADGSAADGSFAGIQEITET